MFGKKGSAFQKLAYDRENQQPILKCSICNGEQVAGLKDLRTGKFEEIMLIRNSEDLKAFKKMCDVDEVRKEY